MNHVTFSLVQGVFEPIQAYLKSKGSEWANRIIVGIKSHLIYLEDPRIASGTLFCANFVILEVAIRISRLVGGSLPVETVEQRNTKFVFKLLVGMSAAMLGNIAFVRASGISLNAFKITAIAIVAFIARYNLGNYIKNS